MSLSTYYLEYGRHRARLRRRRAYASTSNTTITMRKSIHGFLFLLFKDFESVCRAVPGEGNLPSSFVPTPGHLDSLFLQSLCKNNTSVEVLTASRIKRRIMGRSLWWEGEIDFQRCTRSTLIR